MSETPAGWYDDGTGSERYWDGAQWTGHVTPVSEPAPTPATADPVPQADEPVEVQSRSAERSVQKRSGGKLVLGGVFGVVVAALVVGVLVFTGQASVGGWGPTPTHEGSGFDTPEEAAVAYVEAIRDQDMTAMREMFAVESFVEQCDHAAHLERIGSHTRFDGIWSSCPFPNADPMGHQANVEKRRSAVGEFVTWPMSYIVSPTLYSDGRSSLLLQDTDAVREFQDDVAADFSDYVFARVENLHTAAPGRFSDRYDSDENITKMELIARSNGLSTSDYVEVVVTFDLDGEEWVFTPTVGRYHDRWYLVRPDSTLSDLLVFSPLAGGFGSLDE